MKGRRSLRYFETSPELIGLEVTVYVRFPAVLREVEEPLYVRGIEISHETLRFWWVKFGPMFVADIKSLRI